MLLATSGNIALDDHNGIVNGSYTFLKHFDIKLNGKKVYDCNDANHAVNIKNLLEYSPAYAKQTASNEFFYLDTSRNAEEREFEVSATNQLAKRRAEYNKGFALRKALLGTSSKVNTEIPLNRYSFFEMLENKLLPNTRVEMNFEIESDGNLIWQAGADCRVVITRMQLYVPRITFNSQGQSAYMSQYLKPHKWTYLRENIERSLFPFLYFDLTKQKMDTKDGTTKLTFKYELSGTTAAADSIYALTLYEQDVELW